MSFDEILSLTAVRAVFFFNQNDMIREMWRPGFFPEAWSWWHLQVVSCTKPWTCVRFTFGNFELAKRAEVARGAKIPVYTYQKGGSKWGMSKIDSWCDTNTKINVPQCWSSRPPAATRRGSSLPLLPPPLLLKSPPSPNCPPHPAAVGDKGVC